MAGSKKLRPRFGCSLINVRTSGHLRSHPLLRPYGAAASRPERNLIQMLAKAPMAVKQ